MEIKDILKRCDHTLLKPDAGWNDIRGIIDDGIKFEVASICIPPCYVKRASEYAGGRVKITTVIGFPHGNETTDTKVFQAQCAIKDGAEEIDMVINIGEIKSGNEEYVLNEIRKVREVTENHILKVIIETCLLTEKEKVAACNIVSSSGADYIKTSTGFSAGGATFEDIILMKENISPDLKIKAAGGIKSLEDAEVFIGLGADRLGTSRIVSICKNLEQRGEYESDNLS